MEIPENRIIHNAGEQVPNASATRRGIAKFDSIYFNVRNGNVELNREAVLDNISGTLEQGNIIYYNGTDWVQLAHGTSGQMLKTGGNGANPSWGTGGDDTLGWLGV